MKLQSKSIFYIQYIFIYSIFFIMTKKTWMRIITIFVIVVFVIFMGLSALMYLSASKQPQEEITTSSGTVASWTEIILTGDIN